MITIRGLLNRIRWDPEFGRGEFAVGYLDRLAGRVVVVPFTALRFEPGDHFSFELVDAAGETRLIPLHRVVAVYRDRVCIWERKHP